MSYVGERIAKVMASRGLCSRREAEKWITQGRVKVNGATLVSPALNVTDADTILIDDKPIPKQDLLRLWKFHKPKGYITTHRDPQKRPTLFSLLPKDFPRVVSIGRLDMDSEGLILLTNSGEIEHKWELPLYGWIRSYRAKVLGSVDQKKLESLRDGITIDNFHYKSAIAKIESQDEKFAWLNVQLTEGKNREVRRIFDYLGWPVQQLIRIGFGPFELGNLQSGKFEEIDLSNYKYLL
ncbi:unnamed protein product [Blepharisma stoltei]|uniref:RNA-binding S4 domain-containing protein n=1 Tax=Blepharisma stoltei TaxID=1481888 RepID=A0AAU9JYE1_9CILI|nr:unnamed protein product [Blepharisma stoltei]